MKDSGFILITVMIFVLLLSLLIEQAFYSAQLEQRLYFTLERRNKLFDLAQNGIALAKNGKLVCNKVLCVKLERSNDANIFNSKAVDGNMWVCLKEIEIKGKRIKWEQLEKC